MTYIIVEFENLDTSKMSFGESINKNSYKFIPIKYDSKDLYVKYRKSTCPFGAKQPLDARKNVELSLGMRKDSETYRKSLEIDSYLVDKLLENPEIYFSREELLGYDEYGVNGKWIRMTKHSYTQDDSMEPLNRNTWLDFSFKQNRRVVETVVFNSKREKIENVKESTIEDLIGIQTEVSILAKWHVIYINKNIISFKPKIYQIRVFS